MEPQLLTVIDKEALKKWTRDEWKNWVIEPKRDGFRLLIVDGVPQSRSGKPLHNIQHILDELGTDMVGRVIDGELHGASWEETSHVARASKSERDIKLTYTIFDCLTKTEWVTQRCDRPWWHRKGQLWHSFQTSDHIKIVGSVELCHYEDFEKFHNQHLKEGCDGTVLKRKDSLYEFKRTKTWLKVKPVVDFDATIVGMEHGEGKYAKTLGKLLCEYNGVKFGLSGMTDSQRKQWWADPQAVYLKTVEVQCRGFHKSGAPIEPRFHRLREDK